ncbi:MAG TPA: acetyl-CoA C-acyltransferase, partial [Burkholderiales bacterium]|nr:acetyl-CoA C-acyltransferase [Burkholderiales bacterium]
GEKASQFLKLPFGALLNPVIGIMKGLTDPMVGLLMGQTAENLAYRFGITRQEMDEYSVRSHQRVVRAQEEGTLAPGGGEVEALYDAKGNTYALDDGVRKDASLPNLAKLKPFFDRKYGNVTPGNSSQITDGAAWLILASEEGVKRFGLKPLGKILDSQWAGLDPAQMGLGPVHAATPILKRNALTLDSLDYWEINEAFAAQVLGCLAAWKDEKYCKEQLDLPSALGELNQDKLNVDGGAVALGHPVGASGARIVLHMLKLLKRKNANKGMASICIGGGLGGAMLLEAA